MINITIDYDSTRKKGIIVSEYLPIIREYFSVEDKSQFFRKRFAVGYTPKTRIYAITPQGRFNLRLFFTIIEFVKSQNIDYELNLTDSFRKAISRPSLKQNIEELNLTLRDYQTETIQQCLKHASGVIVLPTSAGKTLVMATLYNSINTQINNIKTLILVPDIQLVQQTYSDFLSYGIESKNITKWTGNNDPNIHSNIIIANHQILQSKKQNLQILQNIQLLIVDECHKLRAGNNINKVLDNIPANLRYGFTGTLPDSKIDQWNIISKLGEIIYYKQSIDLRQQKHISDVHVVVLKLCYNNLPNFSKPTMESPTAAYEEEIDFLQKNNFRNTVISKLTNKVDKNMLILVDRIVHGELLLDILKTNTDKKVFFVQGSVELNEREKIRNLMEKHNNVICIAISKIFSTGINIKNLHYIVFAAIGKAKIKIIQSIGRSLRLHTSKKIAAIFDIGDNLRYGNQHLISRLQLYDNEQIPYSIKEINEVD
jgi:superfamily II DNA or RNA helicase